MFRSPLCGRIDRRKPKKTNMKKHRNDGRVRALTYIYRYMLFGVLFIACWVPGRRIAVCSAGFLLYSLWTLLGYRLKWRHIYCAYQIMYHRPMTPGKIDWKQIRKSDIYGPAILIMVFGLLFMVFVIHPEWRYIKIR